MSERGARLAGWGVAAAGAACVLLAVWMLYGTGLAARNAQQDLREQFAAALIEPSPAAGAVADVAVPTGAFGLLTSPALGAEFDWVVGYGVGPQELRRGPGYYLGTGTPGELGNVVISGHRTTYGGPFGRLDELEPGDTLHLRTLSGQFTYQVRRVHVVSASDTSVLEADPQDPQAAASRRLLTLTTCHPRFSARQRLIVVAEQVN